MIGQVKLLDKLHKSLKNFPRFIMLVGQKGSGKKLMCREIASMLGYPLIPIGVSVEEVRTVIQNSYRNTEPMVYVLSDTDKMSVNAKNALLKITEEPPQKAYFILTLTDTANTLNTLISRACVLRMDSYTPEQLYDYLNKKYDIKLIKDLDIEFIKNTATVPEQVDTLMTYDIKEFRNFVQTVATNLHTVSSANAFKIEQKLALKKDEDKWDLLLFLQALSKCYTDTLYDTHDRIYLEMYKKIDCLIKDIHFKNSLNLQYALDECILQVRQLWR